MIFNDLLYGRLEIPDWLEPFLRIPEFVRLRSVRLSNIDSIEFKDFNGPNRWEHSIGVAYLALKYSEKKGLSIKEKMELTIAGLLHDIATPPFGHTVEYVLDYDHELEAEKVLTQIATKHSSPGFPVFASQLPQFRSTCEKVNSKFNHNIDPDNIASLIIGDHEKGYLINGSLDLDNADNVVRASYHMGLDVDSKLPLKIVSWLANLQHPPTDLNSENNTYVETWIRYRNRLYQAFFQASDIEIGREALLQHIIRKAFKYGLSRQSLIWSTDERLLFNIESLFNENEEHTKSKNEFAKLNQLVQRYRLLEETVKICEIPLNKDELNVFRNANAKNWLEEKLSTEYFDPFIIINKKRYATGKEQSDLFSSNIVGTLKVFKLGKTFKLNQLPDWIIDNISNQEIKGDSLKKEFTKQVKRLINDQKKEKPWMTFSDDRKSTVVSNLESVGNWSFRLSRNDSIHAYPSTFVHAIPAALINSLGLKGGKILDPFGGTGQTAAETIKYGGEAISVDSNTIATLVAKTKLTFLEPEIRERLRHLTNETFQNISPGINPEFDNIEKWHHPDTVIELAQILTYINGLKKIEEAQFLKTCFSSILTSTTARRGKEHGYFADNTPLSKDEEAPPYQNAIELFVEKISTNLDILEKFYLSLNKNGYNPKEKLERAEVLRANILDVTPSYLNIEPNSLSAIITSPPYLCMSDYSLGQRLSYYWLYPDRLDEDFDFEIAPRRKRFSPEKALKNYYSEMGKFANVCSKLIKRNGFLATVIGTPVAKAFKSENILPTLDEKFSCNGFELVWDSWRPINWHRNHGYQRLNKERISVYRYRD